MKMILPFAIIALFTTTSLLGEDWPAWRGPLGTGHSEAKTAPLTWSKAEHVVWRTPLDAPGNSTPIVIGERLFLTHAPEKSVKRGLLCFDVATGRELWKREVDSSSDEKTHATNPFCAPSPVSDGQIVVAWHGEAGLVAYDLTGKEIWNVKLGRPDHIWGLGASPVIVGELVIQSIGPGTQSSVAAVDKKTGKEVWRKEFPGMSAKNPGEFVGSWSTPVVRKNEAGQTELLLALPDRFLAVDPATGNEIWSCAGPSKLSYTSPLIAEGALIMMCGYHGPALAVRGGAGDITSQRLWLSTEKPPQRVGSGIAIGNDVFILNENGQVWCLDALTGKNRWQERLAGGPSWSSMTLAAGRIYVPTTEGTIYVIEPNVESLKVLAKNELGETMRSSLAFSNGRIFARTYKALYCIGE